MEVKAISQKENTQTHKPVFILFLGVRNHSTELAQQLLKNMDEYLTKHTISKDFHMIIIPVNSETKVQIFYPEGTKNKNYDDIIKEIGKLVALKNIRIGL